MADLNPQQQEAVQHGNGPLLIIAGAGTGKTTVITERIKHLLLDKHVPASNILALTFTEKAAVEMEERIDIALPLGYSGIWIDTFHAFCDRILKQEGIHIGLNPDYKLTTEAENILFLRKNIFKLQLEYFRPLGNPSKFLQGLLQHFSRLKDEDVSPEEYVQFAQAYETQSPEEKEEKKKLLELANAYKTYEELKIQEGIMDFSDLISYTLKLFRERKSILKQYQDKFAYILIDEFQDTNFAQNQLAQLLAGNKQNITVVGDDDQAIYRWRGAAISNMIQFREHFPTTKIVTLTENYRSTQTILDSAYQLIQHNNPDRLEVKEGINKKLTAFSKKTGDSIELIISHRGDEEAETVVKKIDQLVKKKKYAYGDIAILVRANDHAMPFIKALETARIPHQFLGPGQLFHEEEIKDILAYLKILYQLDDSASLYRVLCMKNFELHPITISLLLNTAKRRNLTLFEMLTNIETIKINDKDKETLLKFVAMLNKHLAMVPKQPVAQLILSFLQDTGLFEHYANPQDALIQQQAQNIIKLFDKLKIFESEHTTNSLADVIEWIDLSMQMGESPQSAVIDTIENNTVNILTIHASKGLEFPIVFIVNLVRDRFPSRQRSEQIPVPSDLVKEILPQEDYHEEEERRLCYVAITRAKEKVFITASHFYGEGKREKKLSPFIAESIGENILTLTKQKIDTNRQLSILDLIPSNNEIHALPLTTNHQPLVKVTYLSYSQIQTFETCPLHYKLRYIMKIPTPLTPALTFGTSIHAALRDFYQKRIQGDNISLSHINELLKNVWNPEGYESKDHEQQAFTKAANLLKEFLTNELSAKPHPIALELPFEFFVNKLRIGGRIDRIDQLEDGSIEIIDYKTGANVPTEKDVAKNLQLTTYALAASLFQDSNSRKTPDKILLSLYYVEQGKKLTTTRTMQQLEEAKVQLLDAAKAIEESDFLCSGSIFCLNCEYKMLCKTS